MQQKSKESALVAPSLVAISSPMKAGNRTLVIRQDDVETYERARQQAFSMGVSFSQFIAYTVKLYFASEGKG